MLFHHHQQQQQQPQQPQHEFHHMKSQLDSSNTPVLQTPTAAAETLTQPLKKRCYRRKPGGGLGEIVEVEGGHILRATGRKDRHSKVCTAKGPRDRRVRLSANTAIQFYDVQDRLGYDRPSKAVDWLMKKAKLAIDELDELPAWTPSATKPSVNDNGTLPPSLESDAIADTIKSFFPLNGAVSEAQSNQFQHYPTGNNSGSQDLKLSLQSFHDPMLIGFDNPSSGWGGGAGGFMLIPPQQQQPPPPPLFHRGPLQSSNTPNSIRAWIAGTSSSDYSIGSSTQDFHQAVSLSSIAAAGFPGYYFPARLQGQQEEHAGIPNKPSSASSPSRL